MELDCCNIMVVDNDDNSNSFENCNIMVIPEHGVIDGEYIERGKYNEVVAVYNYKNGKREGYCQRYENCSLKEVVYYENDVKVMENNCT